MLEQDLNMASKRAVAKPKAVKQQAAEEQSFDDMLESIPADANV